MKPYLTREELNDYVWSYPLGELSRRLAVSIDAIREACKATDLTVPELSYWMALRRGETPIRPALSTFTGETINVFGVPVWRAPVCPRQDGILSEDDLVILTGRKLKTAQCAALRSMEILFAVNAMGHPIVPLPSIEGPARQARQDVRTLEDSMAEAMRRHR